MKKIALTLLVACLCLEAGCSRPTAEAPVVATSPTPPQLTQAPVVTVSPTPVLMTEEEKRQDAAAEAAAQERKQVIDIAPQAAEPAEGRTPAPSPSPVSSPRR